MHASLFMHRDSIFVATLETHFGHTAVVGSLALVTDAVSLGTCETETVIGDQFEDFGCNLRISGELSLPVLQAR